MSTAAAAASAWTLHVFWMPELFLLRNCIPQPVSAKNSIDSRPRKETAPLWEKEEGPHFQSGCDLQPLKDSGVATPTANASEDNFCGHRSLLRIKNTKSQPVRYLWKMGKNSVVPRC